MIWKLALHKQDNPPSYICAGLVPVGLADHDWHDGVREPGVLHRDGRGGHRVLLHPPGHVVGGADPDLPRLRGLSSADSSR